MSTSLKKVASSIHGTLDVNCVPASLAFEYKRASATRWGLSINLRSCTPCMWNRCLPPSRSICEQQSKPTSQFKRLVLVRVFWLIAPNTCSAFEVYVCWLWTILTPAIGYVIIQILYCRVYLHVGSIITINTCVPLRVHWHPWHHLIYVCQFCTVVLVHIFHAMSTLRLTALAFNQNLCSSYLLQLRFRQPVSNYYSLWPDTLTSAVWTWSFEQRFMLSYYAFHFRIIFTLMVINSCIFLFIYFFFFLNFRKLSSTQVVL